MKILFRLAILLIFVFLNSCSKEKEISLIKEINQEDEMVSAYLDGIKNLDELTNECVGS